MIYPLKKWYRQFKTFYRISTFTSCRDRCRGTFYSTNRYGVMPPGWEVSKDLDMKFYSYQVFWVGAGPEPLSAEWHGVRRKLIVPVRPEPKVEPRNIG